MSSRRLFLGLDRVVVIHAHAQTIARIMVHARRVFTTAVAIGHLVAQYAVGAAPVGFRAATLAAVADLAVVAVNGHGIRAAAIIVAVIRVARTILIRRRFLPARFAADRAA